MRGLTFSVRSYVFKAAREGAFFQSIVRTAKEEWMVLEDFREPKRDHFFGQFSGALFKGRGLHIGGSSFQYRGLVHISMPPIESG
ncbi:hypothetical protein R3W88_011873 [Solanum pinnatisectum]|uniref:Uncharacterized protein n=1 Tax=Solanum pinnatisectum TaxID=50273 RepID=A0AAV9LB12_9SOLN|nr:hypothetical protein R3W88_011873 [Solanum pinnatisectum]